MLCEILVDLERVFGNLIKTIRTEASKKIRLLTYCVALICQFAIFRINNNNA